MLGVHGVEVKLIKVMKSFYVDSITCVGVLMDVCE